MEGIKDMLDNMKQELQYEMIAHEEYIEKDINNFIEFMNKDEDWEISINDGEIEVNDYHKNIAKIIRKLKAIIVVCETKKIEKNRQDFKELAKDLKTVSDLMIEVSNLEDKKQENKTDFEKLKECIEKLFE